MTTQNPSQPGDLLFELIVEGYLSNARFVRRDWLSEEIRHGSDLFAADAVRESVE